MLSEFIKGVNDKKLELIQKWSGTSGLLDDEVTFIDDALLKGQIENLKEQYSRLNEVIETLVGRQDPKSIEQREEILKVMRGIQVEVIFLAANNLKNIDSCLQMASNLQTDFILCLEGLKHYEAKAYDLAYQSFSTYFKKHSNPIEHYQVNKAYGSILYKAKQYQLALTLLQRAVALRPEDIEVHRMIHSIYIQMGEQGLSRLEEELISILGGDHEHDNVL